MIVLVCGGRYYERRDRVYDVLDWQHDLFGFTLLGHGDATGADALAKAWAFSRGVAEKPWPADWAAGGKAAGPRRNRKMLRELKPQHVIAFPGDRGTAGMVALAKAAGLKPYLVPE